MTGFELTIIGIVFFIINIFIAKKYILFDMKGAEFWYLASLVSLVMLMGEGLILIGIIALVNNVDWYGYFNDRITFQK